LATELEDKAGSDGTEGSDGYDEAIAALSEIVNNLQLAVSNYRGGTTLRSFNLINLLIDIIEEPTLEDQTSHDQIPG
jgi:hypothetical protein